MGHGTDAVRYAGVITALLSKPRADGTRFVGRCTVREVSPSREDLECERKPGLPDMCQEKRGATATNIGSRAAMGEAGHVTKRRSASSSAPSHAERAAFLSGP